MKELNRRFLTPTFPLQFEAYRISRSIRVIISAWTDNNANSFNVNVVQGSTAADVALVLGKAQGVENDWNGKGVRAGETE